MTATLIRTGISAEEVVEANTQVPPRIDHFEKHGYLFGQKLAASMSPLLHEVVYRELGLNWGQVRLDSLDLNLFLRLIKHPNFFGASVTMPHKVSIMPYLDELTPECRAVGACNTIFVRKEEKTGRRLFCGTNTDVVGVRESFLQNVSNPTLLVSGRPGLVIGGGGAARSAIYALRHWLGVSDIYLVNRDRAEVEAVITECTQRGYGVGLVHVTSVAHAQTLECPGAIVACIPDLPPQTLGETLARRVVEVFLQKTPKGAMLEMCYNPTPFTALGDLAARHGWQVILGTEALIYQGIEQDRYWTGRMEQKELPIQAVKAVIASRLQKSSSTTGKERG